MVVGGGPKVLAFWAYTFVWFTLQLGLLLVDANNAPVIFAITATIYAVNCMAALSWLNTVDIR